MGYYKHFILVCALLSTISCIAVLVGIHSDPMYHKSVNTRLIYRLLLSDFMICVCYGAYYAIESTVSLNSEPLATICLVWFPFPLFFYISSWGWTALLAYRFSVKPSISKTNNKVKKLPMPMYYVWIIAFLFCVPLIIANVTTKHGVTSVEASETASRACIYNYDSKYGADLDMVTLIVPLFIALIYNIYCYGVGLYALKTAPQSVIARQMRRARGYVMVLIIVWLPNSIFGFMRVASPEKSQHVLLNISVTLTALQGFFNVLVYVRTNKHTRNYLSGRLTQMHPTNIPIHFKNQGEIEDSKDLRDTPEDSGLSSEALEAISRPSEGSISILKASNSKILINHRALNVMQAEEAEYESQMEIQRKKQQLSEGMALRKAQNEAEFGKFHHSMGDEISVGSHGSAIYGTQRDSKSIDSARSLSSNYNQQCLSASPISKFVSPLWANVDSDEDEDEPHISVMNYDISNRNQHKSIGSASAQTNMNANRMLGLQYKGDVDIEGQVSVNNPLNQSNDMTNAGMRQCSQESTASSGISTCCWFSNAYNASSYILIYTYT